MNRKETAVDHYKNGYNCAQAVACTYADVLDMSEEHVFRMMEGFGKGMSFFGHTCGACTSMVLVTSYLATPDMKTKNAVKNDTYPVIKPMIEQFQKENGYVDCFDILKHGEPGTCDGKRICCIHCVEHAIDHIEAYRKEQKDGASQECN